MTKAIPPSNAPASSPLAIEHVIAGAIRRSQLRSDGGALYWLEQRPEAKGRGEIRRWSVTDGVQALTPDSLSVRSRVHEYGGGEFAVRQEQLVFTADPDQRLWLRSSDGKIRELLPASMTTNCRFADFAWHPNGRALYAVRERHDGKTVSNDLVRIDLYGTCTEIAQGADFYAAPTVSADGFQLAWLQWNHPQMPWDGTELWQARLSADGAPTDRRRLAGGPDESIVQAGYTATGRLLAMTDRSGFWQLAEHHDGDWRVLAAIPGECAVAPWSLGSRTWVENADGDIHVIASVDGRQQLWCLRPGRPPEQCRIEFDGLAPQLAVDKNRVFVLACGDRTGESVLAFDSHHLVSTPLTVPPAWPAAVSITPPVTRRLPSLAGELPFHLYQPPTGGLAPLLVLCHSGPTGQALPQLQAAIQFWTSRGVAVADVNYRGSDGYGRRWRQSLLGQWGQADVADCLAVIDHLLATGQFDPHRIFVRGNSAGALTVLRMLAGTTTIRAAAVRYPVVDLPSLAAASHKFEARYLDQLVGGKQALATASPSRYFNDIRTPLLIQHGDADPVVPLSQAQLLAAALTSNGVDHELKVHAGEGHGFRRAETLAAALEAEWAFFSRMK